MVLELLYSLGLLRGQEFFFFLSSSVDKGRRRTIVLEIEGRGYSKGVRPELSIDIIAAEPRIT